MKVEGPGRTQSADKAKKKDGVSGDGSFEQMLTGGAPEASAPVSAGTIARVDSLLSVQAMEDPTEKAASKRMMARADNVLKELDKIRVGLLTGTLNIGQLLDIADVVASHRERIVDPRLTAILDEIDLRAQIEVAKMRVALDKAAGN